MAMRTKKKRKASNRLTLVYHLCCMSAKPFTHPGAPYRVYIAENKKGLVVGRYEAKSFKTRAQAERWMKRHCKIWTSCDLS
jgi:hypothetical protein